MALVTGIVALFPIAVVAGIVALVQIRRREQRGTGLAIAGIVLGGLWALFVMLAVIGFVLGGASPGSLGRVANAGSTTIGSCLEEPAKHSSLAAVTDCSGPHGAEVFKVTALDGSSWPGYDEVDSLADDLCYDSFDDYVGGSYDSSSYDYAWFAPDDAEWRSGERRVVCVVVPYDQDKLNGSVRGTGG